MIAKRLSLTLALLLASNLAMAVPQPIRDSAYDWRCLNPDGTATNHQRQDTAIYACQTRAEANPGQTYYIEGGRYRVLVAVPGPDPVPDPVNCAGSWSSWARVAGSESACVDSQRTFSESRAFTVTTPPANGGTACPTSPQTRSASEACTMPPVGSAPYDLSGYDISFAYSWPTPPNIALETTVTPATLAANNVNGRRLILQAGNYGNVSSRDDQEWVLRAGANIDNFNFAGSHRLKVRGETPRAGRIGMIMGAAGGAGAGTTDILFDQIYQTNGPWTRSAGEASNSLGGHRVAVIRSSLNTASYTIYTAANRADDFNNLIVAGNYIRNDNSIPTSASVTPQHTVRIMSVNTFIFADNYFEKFDTGIIWRVHTNDVSPSVDSFNGYIAGNTLVRRGGTIFSGFQIYPASNAYTPGQIRNLTFHANEIHQNTGGAFAFDMDTWSSRIVDLTITNNFSNGGDGLFNVASRFPSFEISGNTSQGYSAASVPTPASKLGWTP